MQLDSPIAPFLGARTLKLANPRFMVAVPTPLMPPPTPMTVLLPLQVVGTRGTSGLRLVILTQQQPRPSRSIFIGPATPPPTLVPTVDTTSPLRPLTLPFPVLCRLLASAALDTDLQTSTTRPPRLPTRVSTLRQVLPPVALAVEPPLRDKPTPTPLPLRKKLTVVLLPFLVPQETQWPIVALRAFPKANALLPTIVELNPMNRCFLMALRHMALLLVVFLIALAMAQLPPLSP